MFKHLLVPTDGSELSRKAALQAVEFARSLGAKITAITVTAPWRTIAVGEVATVLSEKDYENRSEVNAWASLNPIIDAAKAADVPRNAIHIHAARPYQAIVEAATTNGCDLIVMGSHGYTGLDRLLIGSETIRTLSHTKVPVLVLKPQV